MYSKKENVKDFWDTASCGEDLYLKGFSREDYINHSKKRYALEPEILDLGQFQEFRNKKTLEIGVGLGADHQLIAESGAKLYGIDLTPRAISHTQRRFALMHLSSHLQVADAEDLPFEDNTFDTVYSWGVLHHSPNTSKAIQEVRRVLKKGSIAKIMIYNKYSIVGYMLWLRYGLMKGKPYLTLDEVYDKYLESPGTKAYSRKEVPRLFNGFEIISINTPLGHGDLLTSDAGQRHRGVLLNIAKKIWPRKLIRLFLPQHGLGMMIKCKKI